jgi:hypothetical protein
MDWFVVAAEEAACLIYIEQVFITIEHRSFSRRTMRLANTCSDRRWNSP